jgi:hypothetical protein
MPVEIRELVVKVTVRPNEADRQRSAEQQDGDVGAELVQECVEQVLRALQQREER